MREELYGTAEPAGACIGKKDEQGNWLFPVKGALDPNDIAICIGERLLKHGTDDEIARPRRAAEAGAERARRMTAGRRRPHAVFLLRLPAQFLDRRAGGHARLRRHRLPLHGAVDGPQHARLHPDGRRGRQLDRRGAVLQDAARVPEPRRRHLQPLRLPGDPRRDRLRRQHHLQDPLQRRRRHDRRPDATTAASPCRRSRARSRPKAPSASSSSPTSRRNIRPAPNWPEGITIHHRDDLQAVQTGAARNPRLHRADLRPDLRRREAPPPQARHVPRSRQARHHQRAGLRGLRRLRREVELRLGAAAGDRVRPQAHHRPVELQQGLLLPEGLLPVLRHRRRREARRRGKGVDARPRACRRCPSRRSPTIGQTYNIIVTGVGGTGIVTIGGMLGMAAHLEGKGVGVIDMAGLAQKGGAVYSHMRIAERPEDIHAIRVAAGGRRPGARRRHRGGRQQEGAVDACKPGAPRW